MAKRKTRQRSRETLKKAARWVARVVLGVVVVSAVLYGVLLFNDLTTSARTFQLDRVSFHGLKHAQEDHLQQLLKPVLASNVLTIRLAEVRALLEAEPWVRSAVVRRRLPDQIEAYVQERVPIAVAAIEGELTVVDAEGVALAPFGPGFEHLDRPIVKGLVSLVAEGARSANARRMELYLRILGELDGGEQKHTMGISEVDVSEAARVMVIPFREPVSVLLGERQFRQRYETFLSQMDLVRETRSKHGTIDWIDVTFDNRIIIHTPRESDPSAVEVLDSD